MKNITSLTKLVEAIKAKTLVSIYHKNKKSLATTAALIVFAVATPEMCFAAGTGTDAFGDILAKATGWIGGSAGKLITFCSLAVAGIMGVAGFPAKQVLGALGVGLLLSSANSIVNMIF